MINVTTKVSNYLISSSKLSKKIDFNPSIKLSFILTELSIFDLIKRT